MVDAIGGAAATALQGPIQVTYREAFQSTILPSFERACQNMFQQINESFHKGTQQCKFWSVLRDCLLRYNWAASIPGYDLQLDWKKNNKPIQIYIMADFEVMLQKQLS